MGQMAKQLESLCRGISHHAELSRDRAKLFKLCLSLKECLYFWQKTNTTKTHLRFWTLWAKNSLLVFCMACWKKMFWNWRKQKRKTILYAKPEDKPRVFLKSVRQKWQEAGQALVQSFINMGKYSTSVKCKLKSLNDGCLKFSRFYLTPRPLQGPP